MKTVARVTWIHEADLIKSRLELEGVQAFIPDEGMATANPMLSNAMGGIRIEVADEDYETAREILGAPLEQVEQGDTVCPSCGSDQVEYAGISKRMFFASMLLLGFPLLWRRRYRCLACGARWSPGRDG